MWTYVTVLVETYFEPYMYVRVYVYIHMLYVCVYV